MLNVKVPPEIVAYCKRFTGADPGFVVRRLME
jgi:hypothetical protein